MFAKSEKLFPVRRTYKYLAHCGVSPLFSKAHEKLRDVSEQHMKTGMLLFKGSYEDTLNSLRDSVSRLMRTSSENIAFIKNSSEGLSMIANGYPFKAGDEIITWKHEYPANYYPWKLQERRGAKLVELSNIPVAENVDSSLPGKWSLEELAEKTTPKTRVFAISHVQFTSGFAADLKKVGQFCKDHNIDLVVDAAQSLGCLPVHPEECNVSAVVSSGWKWLMGPVGTGVMYTSPAFRKKLDHMSVGAELMSQGMDYLDHTWAPVETAKRFEYSTSPITLAAALDMCIREICLRYGVDVIFEELIRLQDLFLYYLKEKKSYIPVIYPAEHRSGILSVICEEPDIKEKGLLKRRIVCSSRGGYLRVAPHFYNSEEDMFITANTMGRI